MDNQQHKAAPASADNPSTAGVGTPRVNALMAKWDDDGATRGSAFCELRDLARELESARAAPVAQSTAGAALSDEEITEAASELYLSDFGGKGTQAYDIALGRAVLAAQANKVRLAAPAAQAPTPTAAEVRDQALEEAEAICQRSDINYAGQAAAEIRALRTASKDQQPLIRCAAGRDGECAHAQCPQLRDNEPAATGRHCPLDNDHSED